MTPDGKVKKIGAAAQKKEIHQSEGGERRNGEQLLPIFLLLLLLRPWRFRSMFTNNYCWKF